VFHLHRRRKQEESYLPVFRKIIVSLNSRSGSRIRVADVSGTVMSSSSVSGVPRRVTDI
jgi:hypothetical protein